MDCIKFFVIHKNNIELKTMTGDHNKIFKKINIYKTKHEFSFRRINNSSENK